MGELMITMKNGTTALISITLELLWIYQLQLQGYKLDIDYVLY